MMRGLVVFAAGSTVLIWLAALAAYALREPLGKFAGLLIVPAAVIPFLLAYLGHHLSGCVGNPYRGLVWGGGLWYVAIWIIGLLAAAVAIAIGLGLALQAWDPEMRAFIELQKQLAGQNIPASQEGALKIGGYAAIIIGPTIGVAFGAAIGCLSTFPWFGWFLRRVLVFGRASGALITAGLMFIIGMAGGMVENPAMGDTPVLMRVVLTGVLAISMVPALLWIFYRTKSAVLPALAEAAYMGGLQGVTPFLSGGQPWLVAPSGIIVAAVALGVGLALWVWKDPGGSELAVAGTAFDGTPLTPEQFAQLHHR